MTGTLQLHPEMYMPISLNMLLPMSAFDDKDECFIRAGQPLAYLFFPGGKPEIKPTKLTWDEWLNEYCYKRQHFQNNWIKEMHKVTEGGASPDL